MTLTRSCPDCEQGKHHNCNIEVLDEHDQYVKCPCLARGHMLTEPLLPYAGTSGHSGTDTSQERAEREDGDGTTHKRQRDTMQIVETGRFNGFDLRAGADGHPVGREHGITVKELRNFTGWHHGQASSTLSTLHKEGLLARTSERRDRCKVYVAPEYLNGRVGEPHGRTTPPLIHQPVRGSDVEAWIKARRDERDIDPDAKTALDNLLDEYRLCADTGRSLTEKMENER